MNNRKTRFARVAHRGLPRQQLKTLPFTIALIAAALLVLVSQARAAESPIESTVVGGLRLPEFIGPLEFIGEHSGPEGTSSLTYSYRAMGMALEISITDLGADGVADGIDAPELLERYAEAKQDVITSTHVRKLKPRHETSVILGSTSRVAYGAFAPSARTAREALFTVKRKYDTGASTYLLFTAVHGLVIDARFDVLQGFEEDGAITHGDVLAALGEAIPAKPDATLEARAQAAAEADVGNKISIVWDPATPEQENRIWLAYLFARATYAVRENTGEPVAAERDASFEEEVRGRSAAVSTFRDLQRSGAHLVSAYFNDIDRVESAGFLREYVWSYLHQSAWVAPPADLKLASFDAWRAEHLPDHVPVTHGRIAFRLAAAK